jgi:hypothetical protein
MCISLAQQDILKTVDVPASNELELRPGRQPVVFSVVADLLVEMQ